MRRFLLLTSLLSTGFFDTDMDMPPPPRTDRGHERCEWTICDVCAEEPDVACLLQTRHYESQWREWHAWAERNGVFVVRGASARCEIDLTLCLPAECTAGEGDL